ncbi:OmpH family outer membrane protein [Cytophagaceae bacterium SJW1-29]|uniref:OmpH family outer membrane protein n=2 Tax=Salmonirosea aquatica TaxID=2654236 RepID=A0A7C9FDA4_9BACT|nr:OmpH family outer membrane protein [Cytophagaceae bacterium SJW1-29]
MMMVFALACTPLLAQTTASATTPVKIGYTNVEFIVENHPDYKKIENELSITRSQLDKALQDKYKEFQEKLDNYNKNAGSMADVLRTDKEKELQTMQNSIQELQRNSETSLQNKYQQLMKPLMDKVNEAIKVVGKQNNYLYILNSDAGPNTTPILLYVGSEEDNVSNLIFKQLGVDPPKEVTTETPVATPSKASTAPPKK